MRVSKSPSESANVHTSLDYSPRLAESLELQRITVAHIRASTSAIILLPLALDHHIRQCEQDPTRDKWARKRGGYFDELVACNSRSGGDEAVEQRCASQDRGQVGGRQG